MSRVRKGGAMPKTMSASAAKNQFGAVLGWVRDNGDEVIVESHGEPRAVIISYSEYETLQALRDEARRRQAWADLERLRAEVSAQNPDITSEEQALAVADQFTREAVGSLIQKGQITFAAS